MPSRTAKFVSTVFAGILASIPLTTLSYAETAPTDSCLSAPKGESPAGSHWYYRVERSTKRHCWYLRDDGHGVSQASPQDIPVSAKPAAPAEAPIQRSVANARAELSTQVNRNEAPNTDWPIPAGESNGTPRAKVPDASPAPAVVTSRWPDPSGVSPAASVAQPVTGNPASNIPPNPVASVVPADVALSAAAEDSSTRGERGLMPLLVAIMGAFTLACGLVVKFARARQPRPRKFRARRGPIWELTDDDRIVLSDDLSMHDLPRRPAFSRTVGDAGSRTVGAAGRRSGRAGDGLSRLSGQART